MLEAVAAAHPPLHLLWKDIDVAEEVDDAAAPASGNHFDHTFLGAAARRIKDNAILFA